MLDWAVRRHAECQQVMQYPDDFLFVGRAGLGKCEWLLQVFDELMDELGGPLVN